MRESVLLYTCIALAHWVTLSFLHCSCMASKSFLFISYPIETKLWLYALSITDICVKKKPHRTV